MYACSNPICLWLSRHIATTSIVSIVVVMSIAYIYFPNYSKNVFTFFSFFHCEDFTCLGWFCIFQVLLSGLEVSIGSMKFMIWLFFDSLLIMISRLLLHSQTTCCYYILYAEFISFAMMHKPYYYITAFKFSFTDTLFYCIAMIQSLFLLRNLLDIPVCLLGNALFKIIIKAFSCLERPTNAQRNTDIGADVNDASE